MLSGHKGASVLQPERGLETHMHAHTHTQNEERMNRFCFYCLTRYTVKQTASPNTRVHDTILIDSANIK